MTRRALLVAGMLSAGLASADALAIECPASRTVVEVDRASAALARYRVQPWESLKLADFGAAYQRATRHLREPWIRELSAGAVNRVISVQGRNGRLVLVEACKPELCSSENLLVLFDPASKAIAYRLREGGLVTTAGDASLRALAGDTCLERVGE